MYMWDLKCGANEPIYEIDSQTSRLVVAKGEGRGEGWIGSLGLADANDFFINWINTKVLL